MGEVFPNRPVRYFTDDGELYSCRKCGCICQKSKTKVYPKGSTAGTGIVFDSNGNEEVIDGCPFCGTYMSR